MIRALTSVLLVLAVAVAAGRQPVAPQFRYQRPVQITAAGPQRLDVDVTLLAGGAPFSTASADDRRIAVGGLSDLRLFTGDNVEVPYLLVWPPQTQPEWVQGRVLGVAATENASVEKTSGFEVDLEEAFVVDAMELVGMRAPFLKRFRLEGSGDRERWTLLIAEGTAFDLPSEGLSQTTLVFTPGAYRYLRVTWDDTNSGRVPPPPVVRARHVQAVAPPPAALRAPLVVERQPSEPRVSRFRIRLPGGRLPVVALELAVGGEYLMREARVVEARLTGRQAVPQQIGRDVLRRVMQDGIAADALRIPIQQPSDAQLELVVDDGDNPPLDLRGVTAEFAELPWIYFEANPGTVTARYGDAALAAPRYDLEAARQDVTSATTVAAVWGDAQARVETAAAAPLSMPDTGGTIDVSEFQFARAIAAAPIGLVAVPLDAAALAHSAAGTRFSDVRVVDNAGRQVPYLLERRDGPITLDIRLEPRDPGVPPAARAGRTSYVVPLPYQTMPATKLTLETRARVFQREVALAELVPANEREREPRLQTLAGARWVHADQAREPVPLVFDVPERRRGDLVLLIDEGDNQPLVIDRARLLLPSYAVRLYQPRDQPLRLVYGHSGLGAPEYDLELLAPQVMGAPAREVHPGPEERGAASQAAMALVPPPVFWGALVTAVIVLLGLIVRLVRRTAQPR